MIKERKHYFYVNQDSIDMLEKKFDFIIIGSGLAGLYSAHCASKFGKVAILTKSEVNISNSYNAQGGIASVSSTSDRTQYHYDDTLLAGRYLCDHTPVEILVKEGPLRIQELIDMGMQFDSNKGKLHLGLEGGHHHRRILHAGGDSTGREITNFMINTCKADNNIEIIDSEFAYKLIINNNACAGVYTWNSKSQTTSAYISSSTILATGGTSAIYKRTTNPNTSTGDGLCLAYNAGAELQDMEFIQFHPSALYNKEGDSFLISEAVRGEGAYLINKHNERFMLGEHKLAELAPRDIVSRSILKQMSLDKNDFVRLSLKHLDPDIIKNRFPSIFAKCKNKGVDMTSEIPIAPAAHYMVGGVKVDCNSKTKIDNLYACGELASTGVMGANRLASNSLLECLVFGKRAISHSVKNKINTDSIDIQNIEFRKNDHLEQAYLKNKEYINKIINLKLGIIRDKVSLVSITNSLAEIEQEFAFENNEYYSIKMHNLILISKLISSAALNREESRGGHFRSDFPQENKNSLEHTIQSKDKNIYFSQVEI